MARTKEDHKYGEQLEKRFGIRRKSRRG